MKMFAPEGMYPASGMFNLPHFIALAICIIAIVIALIFTKNFNKENIRKLTLHMAIVFTILEIARFVYKFAVCKVPFYKLDSWSPLFYCSMFIYSCWFASSKNKTLSNLGSSFLCCGAFTGGLAFLVVPATSLPIVPIWHFLSIHSLLYHSSMVFMGLLYIKKGYFKPGLKVFTYYTIMMMLITIPSLIINYSMGTNLMLLTKPFNIPFDFVNVFYNTFPYLYPLAAILVYLFIPFLISYGIYLLLNVFNQIDFSINDTVSSDKKETI